MSRPTPRTVVALAVMSTAILLCTHTANASETKHAPSTTRSSLLSWKPRPWQPRVAAAPRALASGLWVSIDPVDGAMSMPPQPLSTENVLVGDDPVPVQVDHYANGMMVAHLDDRFAQYSVVTIGSDGKPHWTCVTGPTQAQKALVAPQPVLRAPAPGTVWEDR